MDSQLEIVSSPGQSAAEHSFSALYRAYLQGAYDALRSRESRDAGSLVHIAVAAMGFVFLGWVFLMIMVFK